MLPYFFIFGYRVSTFSLCIMLGVVAFIGVTILLEWCEFGYTKKSIVKLLVLSLLGLIILGIFAFLFNSLFHSIKEGKLVIGGITWLGGFLAMVPFMLFMLYFFRPQKEINTLKCFNTLIPGIVIAHSIGRVGCFLNGCCYGAETDCFLGVEFPRGSFAAMMNPAGYGGPSVPLHPTQLYECLFELILFMVMIFGRKKLSNYYLPLYCSLYAIFRFFIEFLRGDNRGAVGLALSPSQLMSIVLLGIGIVIFIIIKKSKEEKVGNGVA